MKFRVFFVGLLLMFSATSALAAGPYIEAAGGAAFIHDGDVTVNGVGTATASYNPGYALNASAGYKFNNPFRAEFEFGYKNADVDKLSGPGGSVSVHDSTVEVMSFMVNGFYEIEAEDNLTAYLGGGVGLLHGKLDVQGQSDTDDEFGYQVIVGGAYHFNKNIALDLSYHFQQAPSDFKKSGVDIEYMSSSVFLGLRYSFF